LILKYRKKFQHVNMQAKVAAETSLNASPALEGTRIIIAIGDLELGGAEKQALLLAEYLAQQERAHVELWGLGNKEGRAAEICEEKGIAWRLVPSPWFCSKKDKLRNLIRLTLALRKARPDAILSYLIGPNVTCGLVWRWTGARTCIWNQRCTGLDRVGYRAEKLAISRVPWFASNSNGGADFLKNTFGIPQERIRVIHNSIDVPPQSVSRLEARRKFGLDDGAFVVSMVANLTKYKDHRTAIRAWKILIDRLESEGRCGLLLLAGRTTDPHSSLSELKILGFDLGLSRSIRFLGEVDDVPALLAASDMSILSSPSESSPNAILEAMAAGLPVSGSDNSGMREALGPDAQEFLALVGDDSGLANIMIRFALDPCLRKRIGSANRVRIEQNFDLLTNCQQMVALIVAGLNERK
jgi:glycosyltransferase involved in cell wall biosynthesis